MAEKLRNNNRWTESRFNSFIKGALRSAARRWGPRHDVKKAAWRSRGRYLCAGYGRRNHIVDVSYRDGSKRVNNLFIDHIEPVIPAEGFSSWDDVVKRMFVEADSLQVLCKSCHDQKTQDERKARKNAK